MASASDVDEDEARDVMPATAQTGRHASPPPAGLRQRPLGRAATFAEPTSRFKRRSSSFMSDSLSESRRSFQASTDDLLRPRASMVPDEPIETSNWHSLPLGLALLPAIGGLFFQNGSAFITDVTLLGLAALFLNWAVRLPWDWYHSAQALAAQSESEIPNTPDDESEAEPAVQKTTSGNEDSASADLSMKNPSARANEDARAARQELRAYELLALLACFVAPAMGSWLLHIIRAQLSRPSEGLVSDFNITIFLLAAEVRPLLHLIKLVQRRTLFLQRSIAKVSSQDKASQVVDDLTNRIEELEAHVSDAIAVKSQSQADEVGQSQEVAKASFQAITDLRKSLQPEIDALNRAMRRYEKRITVSAIQTEARLQDLESRVNDVVVLAAAAHRSVDEGYGKYTRTLLNSISAVIVVPIQYALYVVSLPGRMLGAVFIAIKKQLGFTSAKNRAARSSTQRQRSKEKRVKGAPGS